jgi:LAGLIDADG-like domain
MTQATASPALTQATTFPALTGDPVFFRTYSRFTSFGREQWENTVERMIDGLCKLGNFDERQESLLRCYARDLKAMPSGRWCWVGGTPWLEQPENFSGGYNCSNFSITSFERMAFMMSLSMMGVGTGTRLEREFVGQLPVITTKLNVEVIGEPGALLPIEQASIKYTETGAIIIVGDSREGWCKAYELLLELSATADVSEMNVQVELGHVRATGSRIKGFGGIANPIGLIRMFTAVGEILSQAVGRQLTSVEVCLILDEIALGVIAGNVRRSANMRQFDSNDAAAAAAKDNMYRVDANGVFGIDPAKDAHRMGNHTLVFHKKPDLARCVEAVTKQWRSGEGAIMWAGESVARANADILDTPESKQEFLDRYSEDIRLAREYLSGIPQDMESEAEQKEYDHRMTRCGINPCLVAGTMVLTSDGHFPIEALVGKTAKVWDGNCWRIVTNFRVTAENQRVFKVTLASGESITATERHSFILENHTRKLLCELEVGNVLLKHLQVAPRQVLESKFDDWSEIVNIEYSHVADKVYCCTIPGSHSFGLSCGILVGNCGEILGTNFMCVAKDTTIITKDGMHEIQSLEGREVEVWNGERWSKVVPIKTGSNRKLLRVSFNDGSYLDTTENHRFLVANRFQKQYQTVEAKDLNTHDAKYSIHTPVLKILHQEGAETDLQEAYTLGVITGDGSVDKNEKLQLVLFGEKQKLSIKGKKSAEKQRDGYAVTCVEVSDLAWVDKSLIYALKHTHVGFETIATWNRASILSYLAGLADTDGTNTANGGIRIYVSKYKRASHIQLLLTKCGIKSSIISIHPKGQVTNFGARAEDLYAISIVESADIPCQRLDTSNSHTAACKGKHQVLADVVELEGVHDTYCFNEPEFHNAVFGNSLTKNCNLSEIHLNQLDPHNLDEQLEAFEVGGLEVAVLLHHNFIDEEQRYSRELDPIVGVSFTGLFDFFVQAFGVDWLRWWQAGRPNKFNMSVSGFEQCYKAAELLGVKIKDPFVVMTSEGGIYRALEAAYLSAWRKQVDKVVGEYCVKNGLKTPNRCTTVQPSGTKSLLTGASPGWHPPKAATFLRRMTFRRNDPVALACIELGYSVIPSQADKDENNQLLDDPFDPRCTEWLVEIPIATSWADLDGVEEIDISKFSATAQFDFYMQVQKYYTCHNTSATIELREEEILPLATKIYESIRDDEGYISAALLQRFDTDFKSYPRLPFEPISKAVYHQLVAEVAQRNTGKTFAEALAKYDNGDLSAEVGPAGCDGDKCLMAEFVPAAPVTEDINSLFI